MNNELPFLSKDITEGKLDSDDALFERFDLGLSSKMLSFMSILVSKTGMEIGGPNYRIRICTRELKAAYENMVVGGYYARRAEIWFDAMKTKATRTEPLVMFCL